jgi:hypothetical protein
MSTEIDRIEELGQLVADEIPGLMSEAKDQITEAINAAVEEAQETNEAGGEVTPKLTLSVSISWDLDSNDVEIKMPVAVKRKFGAKTKMPDHSAPELPGTEGARGSKAAVRRLAKRLTEAGAGITVTAGGQKIIHIPVGSKTTDRDGDPLSPELQKLDQTLRDAMEKREGGAA